LFCSSREVNLLSIIDIIVVIISIVFGKSFLQLQSICEVVVLPVKLRSVGKPASVLVVGTVGEFDIENDIEPVTIRIVRHTIFIAIV